MSAVRSSGLALPADAARFFEHQLQFRTDPADLAADLLAKEPGIVVIDTRSTEHYSAAHIPGAISFPHRTMTASSTASLFHGEGWIDCARYTAEALTAGQEITGPAVIEGYTATTWVPPGWTAALDPTDNLIVRRSS